MYSPSLYNHINTALCKKELDLIGSDNAFYTRFLANAGIIKDMYDELYGTDANGNVVFESIIEVMIRAYLDRAKDLRARDAEKLQKGQWFLSQELAGMSLYVDRFCGKLNDLESKLDYLKDLGVNLLHLMPIFESPQNESDGGYAVSDFRKVDERFGSINDLRAVRQTMHSRNMHLMLDIVLNHTSHRHEWARKAKQGDEYYQDFYYCYDDRSTPDEFERFMPEIFPEAAPGSFTYVPEMKKWVMTVFHNYQWDLNYTNPRVLSIMLDTIFFYANLGVDVLRIDAPAFIWKQIGTTCQNLPQAHTLLRIIRHCVQIVAPGMALLGEAIVAPKEIMKYFGTGSFKARECDFAYNATQMALQWDALATGDVRVMMAAQHELLKKPLGTSWITYTRCHDDIGLGYEDYMIEHAGFNPYAHRDFLKNYYSGKYYGSPAKGELFSSNPKTGDARISGTLASLCGLENAVESKNKNAIELAIRKIIMMQAHSFFIGGMPMLFYGDEVGYTNDYSYLRDPGKNYDNRWMHRPVIDWKKVGRIKDANSVEGKIFSETKKLLALRKSIDAFADCSNIVWLRPPARGVAAYVRHRYNTKVLCLFNYRDAEVKVDLSIIGETGDDAREFKDLLSGETYSTSVKLEAYGFVLLGYSGL